MKTYGMLLSDGGNIALTFADDRTTTAKWADGRGSRRSRSARSASTTSRSWTSSADVALTDNCVRNP